MTKKFKDTFSTCEDGRDFLPGYPSKFIHFISRLVKYRGVVWHCNCGYGKLSLPLAEEFQLVMATDSSLENMAKAPGHKGILYTVQAFDNTDFPDEFFDMIVVQQAPQLFEQDAFLREVDRLLGPGGVIVFMGHGLISVSPEIDSVLLRVYNDILGAYWPQQNRHIHEGLAQTPWPFEQIDVPDFDITCRWTRSQLLGYLNTWSAVKLYEQASNVNPLKQVMHDLEKLWGKDATHTVRLPLFVKAGRVGKVAASL